ncbi:hypothetical protein OPQ81_001000 [Rhizoctonia solani]|nr:hypothetical protein OPQ81_001000 [Rhizoctonia solani]
MTAYHPYLQTHSHPYVSYNHQRGAEIDSTISLFDELDNARNDNRNSHMPFDYPISVTGTSSSTHTHYPSSEDRSPNLPSNIYGAAAMPTSTVMGQYEPGLSGPPTNPNEAIDLNLLLAEWVLPELTPEFQTIPGVYTAVAPPKGSSNSSPMMPNYNHASRNASHSAPQTLSVEHLQPSPIPPQSSPVPARKSTSPGSSPGPCRSNLRPEGPTTRKNQKEETIKGRTCVACRTAKAWIQPPKHVYMLTRFSFTIVEMPVA